MRGLRVTTPLLALPPHVPAGLPFRRHGGLCASDASTGSEVLLIAAAGYHSHAVVASRGIFSAPCGRLPEVEVCGPQTPAGLTSALQLPAVVLGVALHMLPREYHSLRVHSAPSVAGHGLCYSDAVAGYLRRR